MSKTPRDKKLFFDLNHPADFHFFKNLFSSLLEAGYILRIVARDKECLHDLLRSHNISFLSRGQGSHSLTGKYLYAIYVLILTVIRLILFRPRLSVSLSSPYLIVASGFVGIPSLCYDDTDINPRLIPLIRRASHIVSPASYPHYFHGGHFRLPVFKELAYLHPKYFPYEKRGEAVFFRITRTDSVHHTSGSRIDLSYINRQIGMISRDYICFVSSETGIDESLTGSVKTAGRLKIHEDLQQCRAFWGNSATMAAEAAILGIPAVFVGAEKFSYVEELEDYGLLFHFHPDEIEASFVRLNELLEESSDKYSKARQRLLKEKIDITGFLIWFIENYPESTRTFKSDPEILHRFRA